MKSERLQVVSVEAKEPTSQHPPRQRTNREEIQGRFERLWHLDPEQFNPMRNSIERERLNRTFSLISRISPLEGKKVVDLGCGGGELSLRLSEAGAEVTALDIAGNALKKMAEKGTAITIVQDCLPATKLQEEFFDCVICTEVIAYLKPSEQRLLMSELARLVKRDGFVICSTPIDIYSEDALEKFSTLAATEFTDFEWVLSWHRWLIQSRNFFNSPSRFILATKDKSYRTKELAKRAGLFKWWFEINSSKYMSFLWHAINFAASPIASSLKQNQTVMILLEKLCRTIKGDLGISHALWIAKRRPIHEKPLENTRASEERRKKPVWE